MELSDDVRLVEVPWRKVSLHTSSHLSPIEAWRRAVSTTSEGRRVLSQLQLENCTQVWQEAKFGERATHDWGKTGNADATWQHWAFQQGWVNSTQTTTALKPKKLELRGTWSVSSGCQDSCIQRSKTAAFHTDLTKIVFFFPQSLMIMEMKTKL